jgi:dTDP-4-amino-4,6-dideoxy-D-galactose acyltransferase
MLADAALVAARAKWLALYSPTHFLPDEAGAELPGQFGRAAARQFGLAAHEQVHPMPAGMGQWLLQQLPWDTAYFASPVYRLFTGLFRPDAAASALQKAAQLLRLDLGNISDYYAFTVIPAEDTTLLQALTGGGWQLVETRLNFYCPVASARLPEPVTVRPAQPADAELIGRIAASVRNPYDRFHADPWFGTARADAFLGHYAGATVLGARANTVLVPNEPGLPIDSFLAISDTVLPGGGHSRVVLTAVGPANRGWHLKLVAETIRRAATLSLPYVLMTTQATNRAVFRTCEKLGFRLGSTTHVLACHHPA